MAAALLVVVRHRKFRFLTFLSIRSDPSSLGVGNVHVLKRGHSHYVSTRIVQIMELKSKH